MKLSQLEQIIEIANVGTLSQAADNLYISQPNLSLSIKNAENELGVKLFNRSSSGMALTHQGREFVDHAKEIVMQIEALEENCRKQNTPLRLELRIVTIGHRVVTDEIVKLLKKYSSNNISVEILNACGTMLLNCVSDCRAELGFCTVYDFNKQLMIRQLKPRKLEYHPLCKGQVGIFVGVNNKRFSEKDETVDLEKISGLPMVYLVDREFNARSLIQQLQRRYEQFVESSLEIRVHSFDKFLGLLNMLDCYAIGAYIDSPSEMVGPYPDVRFIPFEEGIIECESGFVQRENTVRSVLANELITNLANRFNIFAK